VATAVATAEDLSDGSYRLKFYAPPLNSLERYQNMFGRGRLTVALQFSCGVGNITKPHRDSWVTGGSLAVEWKSDHVTIPRLHFLQPPQISAGLSKYDHVAAYGDSLQGLFVGQYRSRWKELYNSHVDGLPRKPQTEWVSNPRMPVENANLLGLMQLLDKWHGKLFRALNRTALLTGSAAWDIIGSNVYDNENFDDHIRACRHYIQAVQEAYPNTDIFWKGPLANHIHMVASDPKAHNAVRYALTSRIMTLYKRQKELTNEMGVPFLDIYLPTYLSSEWLYPGDIQHYRPEFNGRIVSSNRSMHQRGA